jgi:hypothetical protein
MKHEKAASKSQASLSAGAFSDTELDLFQILQDRYREGRDFFSEAERLRLRFIRWLYQTRPIEP